jgi:DNA-binding NarL/FixJ family response regulator
MAAGALPTGIVILDGSPAFVAAARDFIDRLAGYASVPPGVVLVDLALGGLELAQRVKQGNPAQCVIGLALFPTPELIEEGRRIGIDAVISKESFADELPGALRRLGTGI